MALSESLRIKSTMPCFLSVLSIQEHVKICLPFWRKGSYLRHDWLAVVALDVAERHLRALVLVELELGEVEVGDVV